MAPHPTHLRRFVSLTFPRTPPARALHSRVRSPLPPRPAPHANTFEPRNHGCLIRKEEILALQRKTLSHLLPRQLLRLKCDWDSFPLFRKQSTLVFLAVLSAVCFWPFEVGHCWSE